MSKNIKSHLFLFKLIEQDSNKCCADCGAEGTRWASWNLGIFLCIRCAGIHRKLGVHISKVKSIDLDSWTKEQLTNMEKIGNKLSQELYEAKLPRNFIRPQTNYSIEEFIRAKYEHKQYCLNSSDNDVSDISSNMENELSKDVNNVKKVKSKNVKEKKDITCDVGESDDSLSDPEYLKSQHKIITKVKACHKVHSDSDLINLTTGTQSNEHNNQDLLMDNNTNILSLYDATSYQGNQYDRQYSLGSYNNTTNHRGYGSATYEANYFTNAIPASSQNNYLKMIQNKLTTMKEQLTSKFSGYDQPNFNDSTSGEHSCRFVDNLATQKQHQQKYSNKMNSTNNRTNSSNCFNSGQTLSPDLWR